MKNPWEDRLSEPQIRGWNAVSAAGLHGKALIIGVFFSETPLRFHELRISESLHSAKGGAVETGCSDLYDVIYYSTI